jgi:hypothetical protein
MPEEAFEKGTSYFFDVWVGDAYWGRVTTVREELTIELPVWGEMIVRAYSQHMRPEDWLFSGNKAVRFSEVTELVLHSYRPFNKAEVVVDA